MAARNHRSERGRFSGSPILLGGICFCGLCGCAMTLRTGKNGAYRYYTCASRARSGPTGCGGIPVRMDAVDEAVIDHLENRLLEPRRLAEMMTNIIDRRSVWVEQRHKHVADLRKRATEAEARLHRLYEAIEAGLASPSDPQLKVRIGDLVSQRDTAIEDADRAERAIERLGPLLTPDLLTKFAKATRKMLRAEDGAYRRDLLRAVAQRVEIRSPTSLVISGCRVELFRTLAATGGVKEAALAVPTRVPGWHALLDSNQRPLA